MEDVQEKIASGVKEGITELEDLNMTELTDSTDLTIMNTYYMRPTRDLDGNKIDDYLIVTFKDNASGAKYTKIIATPSYTFFKANDNIIIDHNLLFIEKEYVKPVTCYYNNIEATIAKEVGKYDQYKENIRNRNAAENRKLHAEPNIFRSDTPITDYYRFLFGKLYPNNITTIFKAYFDIEVDAKDCPDDFVKLGEYPINAISFMDERHDIIHSFLLRNSANPLIQQLEDDMIAGRFTENDIREFIKVHIGGDKMLRRYKMANTRVQVHFYDNEIDMLKEFFGGVHHYQPDFILSWNGSAFDLQYIIERIIVLGQEPADIMCDPRWPLKIVRNWIDQKNLSDLPERGDYTYISGNTVWLDQMIQYASRRKAKWGSIQSMKLDDIGYNVAKVKKLSYHHITHDLTLLPYLDFKTFMLYNIFDVIVQHCIEFKTQDVNYIFSKCIMNNTSYQKGHRQTVYLANRMNKEFDNLGFVIGNNKNKWNEKPDPFLGALVGDPMKTGNYSKVKINGIPVFVSRNLQDFDYKSLYPSIMLEFNIAPNTQIGRIMIDDVAWEGENAYLLENYSRGGEFVENMCCDNYIEFCHRWFGLANMQELLEDFKEFMVINTTCYSGFGEYDKYHRSGGKMVVVPLQDGKMGKSPIMFHDKRVSKPLVFRTVRPEIQSNVNNWRG